MKILRPALSAFLFLPFFCASLIAAAVWPPESDIPQDPNVVSGQLGNGFRYAILKNNEPRDRASIRLLVQTGSINETDDERGLAHYLEHMAFNGTTHFPGETLVEWFQRNGMSFGGDSNASTGFTRTMYMLELPKGDPDRLGEGFAVLRDFADGMLIEEEHVERERGIIFAEKRSRDSVEFRTSMAEFLFALPDSLVPHRFPIGVTETLEAADRERLLGFYRKWYRPELMALTVVGEVDTEATVALIEDAFGSLEAAGETPAEPDLGDVLPLQAPVAGVHREEEASAVISSIQISAPYSPKPDSVADRLADLPLNVANAIINRRLAKLARQEDAVFTNGTAYSSDFLDFARSTGIDISGPPGTWRDALALADREIRRALEYGFHPAELEEISVSIINGLEESVRGASTRQSAGLANALTNAIDNDMVFNHPEADLAFSREPLESLTVEDCVNALREVWSTSAPRIFISGKVDPSVTPEEALEVFRASSQVAVEPPEEIRTAEFVYTDFGPPGEVVMREHVEDLDVTLVEFSNGVRLNLKKTDFDVNSISFTARIGGGTLELPLDQPALATIAGSLYNQGGLGAHDIDELRRVLAGKSVGVGFSAGSDAFVFSGGASPKDLELGLQLLCAYITDPGLRANALAQIRRATEESYERMLHIPGGIAQMEIPPLLASGDPRFGVPPLEDLLAITAEDVGDWIKPLLEHGAMEVAIVGDLSIDDTIEFASRTIGALPVRHEKPAFAEARKVSAPAEPISKEFTVETEIQKAIVSVNWPTNDGFDIGRTRRLSLFSSVFSDRLRVAIREELGAAYSPSASSSPSLTYPGYGWFSVGIEVDPQQTEVVTEAIMEIARELVENGVTEDELERAIEPVMTSIHQSVRQNGYWLRSVLSQARERPESLEWSRTREADYRSITTEDLNQLARLYFDPARASTFVIRPVSPAEAGPE